MGLPAVIGGVLVVHSGLLASAREYGGAVIVLAAIALLGCSRHAPVSRLSAPADRSNQDGISRLGPSPRCPDRDLATANSSTVGAGPAKTTRAHAETAWSGTAQAIGPRPAAHYPGLHDARA